MADGVKCIWARVVKEADELPWDLFASNKERSLTRTMNIKFTFVAIRLE